MEVQKAAIKEFEKQTLKLIKTETKKNIEFSIEIPQSTETLFVSIDYNVKRDNIVSILEITHNKITKKFKVETLSKEYMRTTLYWHFRKNLKRLFDEGLIKIQNKD